MTLAQNHLRPSSGNNLLFFLIVAATTLIFGCATSKATTTSRPKVIKPSKESPIANEDDVMNVDTVEWVVLSEEEYPPIKSTDILELPAMRKEFKDSYEIALLLPFEATSLNSPANLNYNQKQFAHFYAGLKLALEDGDEFEHVSINITTYDTNRDQDDFQRVLDRMSRYMPDVIVGPYTTNLIKQTASFAKENRIPLISPWKSSTSMTSDNLFYLQMRPNIMDYYRKMVSYVNANHDRSRVWVVGRQRGQDDNKIKAFQTINQDESVLPVVQPYHEYNVSLDTLMQSDSLVFSTMLEEGVDAVILPHYNPRDERYLYSLLRKIYAEKGENDISIYTMPLALSSDQVDINILKNLDIKVCEFKFADTRNPQIQRIRENYYDNYGWLPTTDSYYGYDIMKFLQYGLKEYGQYFHYYMAGEKLDLMQMNVQIIPYRKKGQDQTEYLTNTGLYMIEYNNDHFVIKSID